MSSLLYMSRGRDASFVRLVFPMPAPSAIDALFALPLAEFTAARNALASRLKKEGRATEAERVKALAKPPASAWAVNQLFWQQRKEIDRLLALGDKVREAQTGKGGDLRALLEQRRKVVAELTKRAAEILTSAGHVDSPDARRRIGITLDTLAAWGRAKAEVQAGRLTADLEPLGFDGLAALLDGKKLPPANVLQFRRAEPAKKVDTKIDARRAEEAAAAARAKEAVKAAERTLAAAQREAERTEASRAKAEQEARAAAAEAKKAAHAVAEAERALAKAREVASSRPKPR
jgi:hypothetical protein